MKFGLFLEVFGVSRGRVGDLVQSASSILSGAQQRAGEAAHNISNMATPGYRARHSFADLLVPREGEASAASSGAMIVSAAQGSLSETGNVLDLALAGEGYFELRNETGSVFTRNGQFTRAEDGRLLGLGGWPVQGQGGGDLVIQEAAFSVAVDGTIRTGDEVIARLSVVAFDPDRANIGSDGAFTVAAEDRRDVDAPVVRQGFLEGSNVSLGDEMIALMEAVRRAETGQRLMNVYDDLMGRAITTFGQASA